MKHAVPPGAGAGCGLSVVNCALHSGEELEEGCSEREFDVVKTLPEGSRQFLVKQGQNSVIAELNLQGFDDELAVLSATSANNALLDQLLAQVGGDPDIWLPLFHQRRTSS